MPKRSRWIESGLQWALAMVVSVLLLDAVAYLGFRERLSGLLPEYGRADGGPSRGYPPHYFRADARLGFDIREHASAMTDSKPVGYGPYRVWGNGWGCFDEPWDESGLQGGVYLAGDSFTWGYVRFERKFGTQLEARIDTPVYACGVTHTGQRHQLEKFLGLHARGLRPDVVVVNVFANDLANDFFFPHSTVLEGHMVETHEQCFDAASGAFTHWRIDAAQLRREMAAWKQDHTGRFMGFLQSHSLSFNVLRALALKVGPGLDHAGPAQCRRSVYSPVFSVGGGYGSSALTAPNREALRRWVEHAAAEGYTVLFSFIPNRTGVDPSYAHIAAHIRALGGRAVFFADYVQRAGLELASLYHAHDGHFNEAGNAHYAEHLAQALRGLPAGGARVPGG